MDQVVDQEASPAEKPRTPKTRRVQPLYAAHEWVYSRKVSGVFRQIKWAALVVLLGLYYVGPWLRWDRGEGAPDQALLIDLPGRRAYFFSIEIWPQEVYYLTGLLVIGAIGLFLITSLAGRVWCGFLCPQTVWTDLFLWFESKIEGDRVQRIRLDQQPMSLSKAGKKILKHTSWLIVALATGGAWILYFNDAYTVLPDIFTGQASAPVYGFLGLFTATTYLLAGWAREQVCIYMCPWPRFQSAMFDEQSLIVTYENWRGEPRGRARVGESFDTRGHCVDCNMCYQVCPTGVDIRKGQQLGCIGCALCVDACNSIMDRFGLPRGLVTYDSIANQTARQQGRPTQFRPVRVRTIAYAVILAVTVAIMGYSLLTRDRVEVNVLHDRAPLFVSLSGGGIRNGFTYKILNMERQPKTFTLRIAGLEGGTFRVVGFAPEWTTEARLPVKPDAVGTFRVLVRSDREALSGASTDFTFRLEEETSGDMHEYNAAFSGPAQ